MKKNALKTIVLLSLAVLCGFSTLSAQEQQEKKVTYNFINEYGFFVGRHVGCTGVFVNGIVIKQTDLLGIGVGYGLNTGSFQEVPVYLNYRHYFDRGRALKPYINLAAGVGLQFMEDWDDYYYDDEYYNGPYMPSSRTFSMGLYATVAGGFRVKAFSFNGGFFFRTFSTGFAGGIEAKVGYTF